MIRLIRILARHGRGRRLAVYLLAGALAWELVIRPIVTLIWPDLELGNSALGELLDFVPVMLGGL